MSDATVGLVINPHARRVRREGLASSLAWAAPLPAERIAVTQDLGALRAAVARFHADGVRTLAVLGGDGTLHHALTEASRLWGDALPRLVVLPGGTLNALAGALGLRDSVEAIFAAALDELARPDPAVRESITLRVRLQGGDHARDLLAHYVGAGWFCQAYDAYLEAAEPGWKDVPRAVLRPLSAALSGDPDGFFAPIALQASSPGVCWPEAATVVFASVVDRPMRGFAPFHGELGGRPAFHAVVNAMPARELALRLPVLLRGLGATPKQRGAIVPSLTLTGADRLFADGEVLALEADTTVQVEMGPRLELVAPRSPRHTGLLRQVRLPRPLPAPTRRAMLAPALSQGPDQLDVAPFVSALRARLGENLAAVVLYGSCLSEATRSTTSFPDFFALVDDYGATPGAGWERRAHAILPPELYHLRVPLDDQGSAVDCKFYLLSLGDLQRLTSRDAPDMYVLGRWSKRLFVAWARDEPVREAILDAHARAVDLAVGLAGATLAEAMDTERWCREVLRVSYRAEQRVEDERKIDALFAAAPAHYRRVFADAAQRLVETGGVALSSGGVAPTADGATARAAAERFLVQSKRRAWARWPKMILSLDNWLDQLVAKVERTHGVRIEVPAWERPVVLLTGWRHFLRLRRQGRIR